MSEKIEASARKIRVRADPDVEKLVPVFLENRRRDVGVLREALDQGDFERIHVLGHSMKGCGGGYSLERIREIGAALEFCARTRGRWGVRGWIDELALYLEQVEVIYD
jgi:HPt (histidine-containing phosphotransfer) domain-containing protein